MGEPGYPTLDQSAAAAVQVLSAIRMDLIPPSGIAVAQFPWEFSRQLTEQAESLRTLATAVQAAAADLSKQLAAAAAAQAAAADKLAAAVDPGLAGPAGIAATALAGPLADAAAAVASGTYQIAEAIDALKRDSRVYQELEARGTYEVAYAIRDLGTQLRDGEVRGTVDAGKGWAELVGSIEKMLKDPLAGHLGEPEFFPHGSEATIGESIVDAILRAPDIALKTGRAVTLNPFSLAGYPQDFPAEAEKVKGAMFGATTPADGHQAAVDGKRGPAGDILQDAQDVLGAKGLGTTEAPGDPENALRNCGIALGIAILSGLGASGAAALASVHVLGSGVPGLGHIAGLLGKIGGWDQAIDAALGALYRAYCGTPMTFWAQRRARPTLPGTGDILRLYTKRLLGGSRAGVPAYEVPYDVRQVLAYQGLDDPWISALVDDADREPSLRDLSRVLQTGTCPPQWTRQILERLQYCDADIDIIQPSIEWAAIRTDLQTIGGVYESLFERGFIPKDEYTQWMTDNAFPERVKKLRLEYADARRKLRIRGEYVDAAISSYQRGITTDAEFEMELAQYIEDDEVLSLTVDAATLERYRKVPLLHAFEEARLALPIYRKLFVVGAYTYKELHDVLWDSGMPQDFFYSYLKLAEYDRGQHVLAQFRTYGLPALRDSVIMGEIDTGAYREKLRKANFPVDYLEVEVKYVAALLARRLAARIERYELPPIASAYIYGLADRACVTALMQEAGLTASEREDQMEDLDRRRAAELNRRKAAKVTADFRTDAREAKAAAERARQAAKAAHALAVAASDILKDKGLAGTADAEALLAGIQHIYADAQEILPDSPYWLGTEIEDECRKPAGPDVDVLAALLTSLDSALASLAGESPPA